MWVGWQFQVKEAVFTRLYRSSPFWLEQRPLIEKNKLRKGRGPDHKWFYIPDIRALSVKVNDIEDHLFKNSRLWSNLCVCVCVLVAQSCLIVCDSTDYSLPGSSVHGIFQAKILDWVAIPFSRGSSQPRDQTLVSCIAGRFWATEKVDLICKYCLNLDKWLFVAIQ